MHIYIAFVSVSERKKVRKVSLSRRKKTASLGRLLVGDTRLLLELVLGEPGLSYLILFSLLS
jgi:hypothetical protein